MILYIPIFSFFLFLKCDPGRNFFEKSSSPVFISINEFLINRPDGVLEVRFLDTDDDRNFTRALIYHTDIDAGSAYRLEDSRRGALCLYLYMGSIH